MDKQEVEVSICCIAYNHEKYIRKALDGFVMQKTNFKYEIIVHDDASTDNTANIIREYEEKYPELFNNIYQVENQYSKGNGPFTIARKKAKGKYIAFCEGDDYWTDENKLQLQFDYMEQNPECSFCFHNAEIFDENKRKIVKKFLPLTSNQKKYMVSSNNYNVGDLALLNVIPSASYFFRRVDEFPDWFHNLVVGDLPLQLYLTSLGYAHYIDKIMCVYRINTGISMMDKWHNQDKNERANKEKIIKRWNGIIYIYEKLNEETKDKYKDIFNQLIKETELQKIKLKKLKELTIEDKKIINEFNLRIKTSIYFKMYFPSIFYFLRKIYRLVINK